MLISERLAKGQPGKQLAFTFYRARKFRHKIAAQRSKNILVSGNFAQVQGIVPGAGVSRFLYAIARRD